MMKKLCLLAVTVVAASCSGATRQTSEGPLAASVDPGITISRASEVQWQQLNPARGDQSPKAADLWGDRKSSGATGFLVEFVHGFSSPPHIHNVTYRGVVIEQNVHNDDPKADPMWMPTGSYWTQPKGAVHITSAKGARTRAYIEIDEGPYLVRPVEAAFVAEDQPVNIHASDIPWVSASDLGPQGAPVTAPGARVAALWGSPQGAAPWGMLVELPAGSDALLKAQGAPFRVVVVQGDAIYQEAGAASPATLTPGSYLHSKGSGAPISCGLDGKCVLYVRAEGRPEAAMSSQK